MLQLRREDLIQDYTRMCTIRAFEDRVHDEFSTGKIPGFVHLYAGEEASAVGVCMHLGDKDRIASTHRGHGHCIAKGCDVDAMMKEIYGRKDGLCGGKGGSMHIADLSKGMMGANGIVGGGPPLINSLVGITALSVSVPRPLKGSSKLGSPFSQDAGHRGCRYYLRRRRRIQPGHDPGIL